MQMTPAFLLLYSRLQYQVQGNTCSLVTTIQEMMTRRVSLSF